MARFIELVVHVKLTKKIIQVLSCKFEALAAIARMTSPKTQQSERLSLAEQ